MPARDFERLLHPIFEEDEFTLIAVGGLLGVAAAWAQLACGARVAAACSAGWTKLAAAVRARVDRARRRGGGEGTASKT